MKLEINKKKVGKSTNMWKLNNILLANPWVKEVIKGKSRNILKEMEIGGQYNKTYGMQ